MSSEYERRSSEAFFVFFPRRDDFVDAAFRSAAPRYPFMLLHEPLTVVGTERGLELWTDRRASEPAGIVSWSQIVSVRSGNAMSEEGVSAGLSLRLRIGDRARTWRIPLRAAPSGSRDVRQVAVDAIVLRIQTALGRIEHAGDVPDAQQPVPRLLPGPSSRTLRRRALRLFVVFAFGVAVPFLVLLPVPEASRTHPLVVVPALLCFAIGMVAAIPAGVIAHVSQFQDRAEAGAGYAVEREPDGALPHLDERTGARADPGMPATEPLWGHPRRWLLLLACITLYFVTAISLTATGIVPAP